MPIIYHEASKEFHLFNNDISYIIKVLKNNQLGQLYYGKRVKDRNDFGHLLELRRRVMAVSTFADDATFSLEHIKQEYPSYGTGDMRIPAYEVLQSNGSRITDFTFVSYHIYGGKRKLNGLPSTYIEKEDEATTLEIHLCDRLINTELILTYTIFEHHAAITRNAKFICNHSEGILLENAMSLNLDLPDCDYEMIELTGAWARERHIKARKLEQGIQSIYSMRGCSSSNYNPFLALKRPNTEEAMGEVYGFSLVYSGNFIAQVEVDTYNTTRIMMGIHPNGFSWRLNRGEEFQTPEVVMVYSGQGINKMSQTYHELYRNRLARGTWRDKVRPILINNWEATYFDFNEDKIMELAKTARSLGIEMLVLDDGWFGKRNDDKRSLGDWYPNYEKLPNGIKGIAEKVVNLGLQFGLWFEPEMVNKDSDLYRTHPDWLFETPGRTSSHGRNQFVLDFTKKEVVDYIYLLVKTTLEESPITYVKWDMNRCMSEVFSTGNDAVYQGKVMHSYILGVYELYDRLTSEFPEVLFESCASGGARFDPGLLYYAPQGWTSDDTDAMERIKIQYGTSLVYPLSSMGSHVSAVPNHQVYRITPIETRANVAYFGTFGYELDLNQLSIEEKEKIEHQVAFMKQYREILQMGTFYRLKSPFEGNVASWMVVSKDKRTALLGYYKVLDTVNTSYERIKLQGLDQELEYQVSLINTTHYGDELMNIGLITSDGSSGDNKELYNGVRGDYQSRIYILKAVDE